MTKSKRVPISKPLFCNSLARTTNDNLQYSVLVLTCSPQDRSQASSYYSMFHHDPLSSLSSSYGRSCGVASQSGAMGMVRNTQLATITHNWVSKKVQIWLE